MKRRRLSKKKKRKKACFKMKYYVEVIRRT